MNSMTNQAQTQEVKKDEETKKREAAASLYYVRTGSYRAVDVLRVLGDPRERVEINAAGGIRLASWTCLS